MIERTEESQVRIAQQALLRAFGGRLPAVRIAEEVEAARAQFKDAKIRTFVPVLIERSAKQRLLTLARPTPVG
ncbi:MAG TPA: hypothetical protein VHV76_04125 [Mycobacteriales bacterium]|nr:hypothetical protein [Mycobacteriales bacterium]